MPAIDFCPPVVQRIRGRIGKIALVGGGGIVVLAVLLGQFRSTAVCTTCGAIEDTTEWQLPLTSITYWRSSSVRQTPLSNLLATRQIAPNHAHAFLFTAGGGNGILCAIGSGRHLWSATQPEAAQLIKSIDDYRGRDEAVTWVRLMLDPRRAMSVESVATMWPEAISEDRRTFDRWWRDNATLIAAIKKAADP